MHDRAIISLLDALTKESEHELELQLMFGNKARNLCPHCSGKKRPRADHNDKKCRYACFDDMCGRCQGTGKLPLEERLDRASLDEMKELEAAHKTAKEKTNRRLRRALLQHVSLTKPILDNTLGLGEPGLAKLCAALRTLDFRRFPHPAAMLSFIQLLPKPDGEGGYRLPRKRAWTDEEKTNDNGPLWHERAHVLIFRMAQNLEKKTFPWRRLYGDPYRATLEGDRRSGWPKWRKWRAVCNVEAQAMLIHIWCLARDVVCPCLVCRERRGEFQSLNNINGFVSPLSHLDEINC